MLLPSPVPETPAKNVDEAIACYINVLGFTPDCGDDHGGTAGISRHACRLFLTNPSFRQPHANNPPSCSGSI